jgi:hypothetical protein
MARTLRDRLADLGHPVTHSQALETVAAQLGQRDWNTLAALIARDGDDPAGSATHGSVAFAAPIPILRIFDVAKAKEFYLGYLGFSWAWEHRFGEDFPLYAEVVRSGLRLHLSEHHGDGTPGSALFLPMTGIDHFHQELVSREYPYARPGIEDEPWGRTVTIGDPFGNQLRFCERIAEE